MRSDLWQPHEDMMLRELAQQRLGCAAIARAIGRSVDGVQSRATRTKVRLDHRVWPRQPRNPDVSSWTDADRLSAWADIPQELAELVFQVCEERNLSVKKVRSDARLPELVACRREIARRARALDYSYPLIGRALNRDHTTVMYGVRRAA